MTSTTRLRCYKIAPNNIKKGGDDIILIPRPPKPLLSLLGELESRRGSVRKDALSSIVKTLNRREGYDCLQQRFATCFYGILNSIKKGCAEEKQLASKVLAGEALAVIFDRDNLDKFSDEASSTASPIKYSENKKHIKETTLKQLEKVASKARSQISLKQNFCNAARADWDVLRYFKEDKFPQTYERINGHKLSLSSWSMMIQLKFLKNFVGEEEFSKHMLENELFHCLFEFTPNHNENNDACLYQSTMEKIQSNFYLPEEQDHEFMTRKEKKQLVQRERKGKLYADDSEL
ncbi:Interferon-related developmental regulator, N-terminal [Sesbania bispinosa]|nr:Interferon-related developmental regulator, N-terminal [Sesbania bispinosa]